MALPCETVSVTLPGTRLSPLRVCGEHGRDEREAEVAHLHAGGSHTADGCTITRARGALVSVWRMAPLVRDLDAHAGPLPCDGVGLGFELGLGLGFGFGFGLGLGLGLGLGFGFGLGLAHLPCQVGDAPAARGAWAADLVRLGVGARVRVRVGPNPRFAWAADRVEHEGERVSST